MVLRFWEASAVSTAGTIEVAKTTSQVTFFELNGTGVEQQFSYTIRPVKDL
jgi:hypothetical protein